MTRLVDPTTCGRMGRGTPGRRGPQAAPLLTAALSFALSACALLPAQAPQGGPTVEPTWTPPCVPNQQGSGCLPLAPDFERVDLVMPSFSNPTRIDNRLHPTGDVQSAVYLGQAEGRSFRAEVTLLPRSRTIDWNGPVDVLEAQYFAYLEGRILEVALDWFAQADDGSVWYFGEDVFNYEDGVVDNTEGTWLAGRDGPAGMIMPAFPQVGNVYRPENIPGLVFEQVTVEAIGVTVEGPSGAVTGAITVRELHWDGGLEEKTFAPGYGEFSTGGDGDVEAVALAAPTDSQTWPEPRELRTMAGGVDRIFEDVSQDDWQGGLIAWGDIDAAWQGLRPMGAAPPLLGSLVDDHLTALRQGLEGGRREETLQQAIELNRAVLDLQLVFRPPAEVDRDRFELLIRQLTLDLAAGDAAAALGDAATLEWIRDRFVHTLAASDAEPLQALLEELQMALEAEDLEAATDAAGRLGELMGSLIEGPEQSAIRGQRPAG